MTNAHKATVALTLFLFGIVALLGYDKYKADIANATLAAQTKANDSNLEAIKVQNTTLATQLAETLDVLQVLKDHTKTTTQIVQALPQVIQLPAPIREVTTTEAAQLHDVVPDAPVAGDLIIPAASAKSFFDAQVTCKENIAKLDACVATDANNKAAIAIKDQQIAQDQVVIKGGTKWTRFKAAVKWIGIGLVAGVAADEVAKHH